MRSSGLYSKLISKHTPGHFQNKLSIISANVCLSAAFYISIMTLYSWVTSRSNPQRRSFMDLRFCSLFSFPPFVFSNPPNLSAELTMTMPDVSE